MDASSMSSQPDQLGDTGRVGVTGREGPDWCGVNSLFQRHFNHLNICTLFFRTYVKGVLYKCAVLKIKTSPQTSS